MTPMEKNSYLRTVLKDKFPHSTEIELHLFEFCNLSCSFCGQDHNSKEGMESIVKKADRVIEFMHSSNLNSHTINVMGGEIFNDEIPANIFNDYITFIKNIAEAAEKHKYQVRFNLVTNLLFQKNRVLVDNIISMFPDRVMLSTSYDFSGRGYDINKQMLFKQNLERYKKSIGIIGFVLTKPSIKKLLRDEDHFFKEILYPNYPLYFDFYVPENASDKMMPSEQELLNAMLYVADHYSNIYPIKDLLENEQNKMTCFSPNKLTILPDGKEVTCRYLDYKPEDFLTPINYNSNENIIEAHLERNNCLSCEWYSRCQFRCFVQADYSRLERLSDCYIRTFFNEKVRR